MPFVHLNVHSNYSFCRGASRLEDLVVAARVRGMDAMALTDTNGLNGLIWFLDAAKAAGLRPIVGAEVDLRALAQRATEFTVEPPGDPWIAPGGGKDARSLARVPTVGDGPPDARRLADLRAWGRAVVLVEDPEGYAALCRLLSALHHGGEWPPPEDLEEERAAARQQGVVERVAGYPVDRGGSGGIGGDVDGTGTVGIGDRLRALSGVMGDAPELCGRGLAPAHGKARFAKPDRGAHGDATEGTRPSRPMLTRAWLAEQIADLRGCIVLSADAGLLMQVSVLHARPDLYVELRPGVARGALLRFARASGIPPVATGGVVLADVKAYSVHRLLRAIDLNTCLSRIPPEEIEPHDAALVSPEEMARRHPDVPEALENAARIAERCRFALPRGAAIFPAYASLSEEGTHRAAKDADPSAANARLDPDALLERDCFLGAERRYGEMSEALAERLEYELSIVREKGFAPYFLVVRDIVSRAPRTCGRGSAAASLISYALGITHVDPIRFDLFFERFLNPGRVDPPDIDVDFPWDERDDILEWVFRRYGRRRVAMISNHVTFQARAAVREIAKVYGLTDEEIGRVTKRMPWFTSDVIEATTKHPVFKDLSFPEPWPEILRLAHRIDGYPRGMSVHCGGIVVVPDAMDRHVPVQPAAKGVDVVQWEKDQSEDAGLVKIDLLGNRSLAVIRDACRAVKHNGGPDIRFETFRPIDDPETQDLIRRGDTVGVFYVESPAMRQLQKKCDVGDFEHLVIHSSIIRPAANEYIREYVRRLRGGAWTPLHHLMAELLDETYGLMVYQEDVAKIAIAMAGFDAASADGLRKILSKKNKEERLRDYRERFSRGATERGVDEATVAKVWDMILSFAGYSFCKPHSASYALVSFKSAFLRAHHPGEFMAAVISNGGGYYSAFAYISECRRMGLRVLLPDVNESRREYTGRTFLRTGKSESASRGEVRVGLMQLKGFPDAGIDAILGARTGGRRFDSFEDFLARCGEALGPAAVKVLVRAGACDSFLASGEDGTAMARARPENRGDLFWRLAAWERSRMGGAGGRGAGAGGRSAAARTRARLAGTGAATRQEALPPLLPPAEPGPLPRSGAYDLRTVLSQEIDALGFLISRHPLALFARWTREAGVVRGCDLAKHVGHVVRVVGWYVTAKTVTTRKGEPMEFLSFEDTTALYETTFFPRTYARFCHMMTKVRPYLLTGRVEEDMGAISLNVNDVRFLDPRAQDADAVPAVAPHIGGTSPGSEAWRGS
jgi:DNA-directed DNA polymerase III PolC